MFWHWNKNAPLDSRYYILNSFLSFSSHIIKTQTIQAHNKHREEKKPIVSN